MSNVELTKLVKESGQKEDDFLLFILESASGKKPGATIWNPVK